MSYKPFTKFVSNEMKQISVRLRDNPPFAYGSAAGFLSLRDGRASLVKKSRKYTLSEGAESIRQIECAF